MIKKKYVVNCQGRARRGREGSNTALNFQNLIYFFKKKKKKIKFLIFNILIFFLLKVTRVAFLLV
jgi:hypothetical protein